MAYRRVRLLLTLLTLLVSGVLLMGAGPSPVRSTVGSVDRSFGGNPSNIRPSVPVAVPGESVTFTVTLDEATSTDQEVAVATSDSSKFVSFPSSVVVPAGLDNVSFTVYVRTDVTDCNVSVSATCNGQTAYGYLAVAIPPDLDLGK